MAIWAFVIALYALFTGLAAAGHPTLVIREIAHYAPTLAGRSRLLRDVAGHLRYVAAVPGRDRQIGADSALRMAARRDGGPDAGQRIDPCGDDGHGRRLHGCAAEFPLLDGARDDGGDCDQLGAVTAFFAATIGITQTDIKKVLAYSTISQLGYMFAAVGVGAYAAAFSI